jgi:predicted esterase
MKKALCVLLISLFFAAVSFAETIEPGRKTGMLDYSDKGYLVYAAKDLPDSPGVLICLPGSGVKAKQEINNWVFAAGKRGFVVLGVDVDYNRIRTAYDVETLYARIQDIVGSLAREYHVDTHKLYLSGTSAGGMMSIALTLHYPGRFVAAGVVSGGRLGYGAQAELRNARGSLFYMVHGDNDERIPLGEFQSTRKQLEGKGALIEYTIVPGGRHTLNSNAYREVVNWLADLGSLLKR